MNSVTVRPGIEQRLAQMIQVPTVSAEIGASGPEPFRAFQALLEELYPATFAATEVEHRSDFGLLLRWPGPDERAQHGSHPRDPVVLMAHFDVVPAQRDDGWTHPPFDGVIAEGWVHGRGALDDKGPLIVLLEAVENLAEAGFIPARDIFLSFGGNEETFGDAARLIATDLRDRGIRPWLVLDEGGAVVDAPLPFVKGEAAMIGVAEKGVLTLALTASSAGGHASAPPEYTAVRRVARAVSRLDPGMFRPRAPLAIQRMLALFALRTRGPARFVLRLLSRTPWLLARVFSALGGEPAALVRTTIAATMQSGGSAANVLPADAQAVLNLRIAVGETVPGVVRRVRRRIGDSRVRVEVLEGSDPTPESPVSGGAFSLLQDALSVAYPAVPAVPYVMMAATDSRHFHRFAPAVYRFAPLRMSAAQRASIHGVDERVEVTSLQQGELFYRALLEKLD